MPSDEIAHQCTVHEYDRPVDAAAFLSFKARLFFQAGRRSDNSGTIALMMALLMPLVVGCLGLGIDTADWYANHRRLERIVDLAASGAAPYLSDGNNSTSTVTAVALNDATLNGLSTSSGDTISVTVSSSPLTVTVTATRQLNQYFSAMFLSGKLYTSATATAGLRSMPVCIIAHAAAGSQALLVDWGASLNAPSCEIDVYSPNPLAGVFFGPLPLIGKVCVAGGSILAPGVTVNALTNHCPTAPDTYTGNIPIPPIGSCTVSGANYSGTVNLNPGVYCGHFNWNGPGTLNLKPGVYIIKGTDWTPSQNFTINGSDVTFYFPDSSSYVDFAGSVVHLSAPTTGTYANILMFEPSGLSPSTSGCIGDGGFNITGSADGNTITGVIDVPSRNLLIASGLVTTSLTLIVNTVELWATLSWSMTASAISLQNPSGGGGSGNGVLQ